MENFIIISKYVHRFISTVIGNVYTLYIISRKEISISYPFYIFKKNNKYRNREKEGNKIEGKQPESAINLQITKNTSYLACFPPFSWKI